MKITKLVLFFLFLYNSMIGQSNSFIKHFGDSTLNNNGHSIVQLASGNFLFVGYSDNTPLNYGLISLTKFDSEGNELMNLYFGDSIHHFVAVRMVKDYNDQLVIAGAKLTANGIYQPYALKVDTNGNVIWQREYAAGLNSQFTGICLFSNNDIGFCGFETDTINGGLNFLATRIDGNGTIKFQVSIGDAVINEAAENCISSGNNLMYICGDKYIQPGIVNPYLVVIDSTGNFEWDLIVNNNLNSGSKSLIIDSNNDLLIVGEAATDSSQQFDITLAKIDIINRNLKWQRYLRGSNNSDAGFAIIESYNHNYLITGYGHDTITQTKRIIYLECDTSANELNKKYFGNSTINIGYYMTSSNNNGVLIAGTDLTNLKRIFIYEKNNSSFVGDMEQNANVIYPNPAFTQQQITSTHSYSELMIIDPIGRLIFRDRGIHKNQIHLPKLEAGWYILQLKDNDFFSRTKLLIEE